MIETAAQGGRAHLAALLLAFPQGHLVQVESL